MVTVTFNMDPDDLNDLIAFLESCRREDGGPLLLTLLLTELRRARKPL